MIFGSGTLTLTVTFFSRDNRASQSTQRRDCGSRVMAPTRQSAARHQNQNLRLRSWTGQTAVISDKCPKIHALMSVKLSKEEKKTHLHQPMSHLIKLVDSTRSLGERRGGEETSQSSPTLPLNNLWNKTFILIYFFRQGLQSHVELCVLIHRTPL